MKYFIVFVLMTSMVSATLIEGDIYDFSLERAEDVIVTINSTPLQKEIAKNGSYSFELPTGVYLLKAEKYLDGLLVAETFEEVQITDDGAFSFDLILFPVIEDELENVEIETFEPTEETKSKLWIWLSLFGVIVIGSILYGLRDKKEVSGDEDTEHVLAVIKREKRVTQKDIRRKVSLSEAKISMIITELENKGVIKKIKKGRGNIIVLK